MSACKCPNDGSNRLNAYIMTAKTTAEIRKATHESMRADKTLCRKTTPIMTITDAIIIVRKSHVRCLIVSGLPTAGGFDGYFKQGTMYRQANMAAATPIAAARMLVGVAYRR